MAINSLKFLVYLRVYNARLVTLTSQYRYNLTVTDSILHCDPHNISAIETTLLDFIGHALVFSFMLGKECRSSYVVYPIFTHLHRCDRSVLLPDRNELFTAAFDRQGSRGVFVFFSNCDGDVEFKSFNYFRCRKFDLCGKCN